MANEQEQLSPLEDAMLELHHAEQAGVFQDTRFEARTSVAADSTADTARSRRLAVRLVPVAAVLLLAVTVWTWMFSVQLAELRQQRDDRVAGLAPSGAQSVSFADCMSGPSAAELPDPCREHDRNGDGFIDLRDYSAVQLASARLVP